MQRNNAIKYINNYRLQYWLYAILAKRYGTAVQFKRDSLHHIYEVNRHGFYVNNIPKKNLLDFLVSELLKNGYEKDEKWNCYRRNYEYEDRTVQVYISISDYSEAGLYIFPNVSKKMKKSHY